MRNKHQIIEEPCEIKVSCTVLKTNGVGDSLVEFHDDTQYKGLLSFRSRLSSGILLRWCTVKVREHRSDLVKPLFLPGRRHCWLHLVQRQRALSFTESAISCQLSGYLFGFVIAHFSQFARSLLLPSLRSHQVKECCKFAQYSISLNAFLTIIPLLV
jgi:hypothetical protein